MKKIFTLIAICFFTISNAQIQFEVNKQVVYTWNEEKDKWELKDSLTNTFIVYYVRDKIFSQQRSINYWLYDEGAQAHKSDHSSLTFYEVRDYIGRLCELSFIVYTNGRIIIVVKYVDKVIKYYVVPQKEAC